KQIANVASLPGIVKVRRRGAERREAKAAPHASSLTRRRRRQHSIGLPDAHSGYGFAIGNTAAFDMDDSAAIVSPGGVGFDINCGVRLIRTNLSEKDVAPLQETLAQTLFDHIPVGVGSR